MITPGAGRPRIALSHYRRPAEYGGRPSLCASTENAGDDRRLNRTENLRPIPEGSEDHAGLHVLRPDAKSINGAPLSMPEREGQLTYVPPDSSLAPSPPPQPRCHSNEHLRHAPGHVAAVLANLNPSNLNALSAIGLSCTLRGWLATRKRRGAGPGRSALTSNAQIAASRPLTPEV
jgi:hypothetical protein